MMRQPRSWTQYRDMKWTEWDNVDSNRWGYCKHPWHIGGKDIIFNLYRTHVGELQLNNFCCFQCIDKYSMKGEGMTYKLAIDADSMLYKAMYRYQDIWETDKTRALEMAYFDFAGEVSKAKGAVFQGPIKYVYGDDIKVILCFSPKISFRHDIYPDYKANRKENKVQGIKLLQAMVTTRMKGVVYTKDKVEADDLVIYLAIHKGYMVSAIDKDVINACPTPCYNYNKFEWHNGRTESDIEQWYLKQTVMGDRDDNIKGCVGIGETGAFNIIHGIDPKQKNVKLTYAQEMYRATFDDIVEYFPSEYDAVLNHMLVRMDQFNGKEIVLWTKT